MKITTQRAHDYHTLTHEIHEDYVRTVLTDRDGWYVTEAYIGIVEHAADAVCQNNDEIYLAMGWDS